MVYRGTLVVEGRAHAIVTATAAETELGRVARLVGEGANERIPSRSDSTVQGAGWQRQRSPPPASCSRQPRSPGAGFTDAFLIAVAPRAHERDVGHGDAAQHEAGRPKRGNRVPRHG
jgi:hypothetical protein